MRILKLPRTTPVGSLIYRLKASAAQENPLKFMVANGTDIDLITIKSVDFYQANVYLNKILQENEYNFTVYVTDGVERTPVDCQIVVKNGSQLMTSSFIHFRPLLSVSESAIYNSTIGYIHVKEKDDSNLPVTFEIEGSDCFGIRYIFGPKGTSKAEIYLKTQLDFETKNLFRLQVYALNAWTNETFDTRNIVMKELIITVINEQDTPPVFRQVPHLVQLTEATEPGDILLTLNAIDGDQEQDRKIKYYLRQDDELHKNFQVDADTGEVTLRGTINSLREIVGNENLFTLTFVAKEVDQSGERSTLTGRKIDDHNYEPEYLVGSLNSDLDLPNSEADSHNHYIVNDNFYDDETMDNQPISSSLTAEQLTTESGRVERSRLNSVNMNEQFEPVGPIVHSTNERRRADKSETLDTLQSINHKIFTKNVNRIPLKSTPINIPPPLLPVETFRKRILSDVPSSVANNYIPEVSRLLGPPIDLTDELNKIEHSTVRTVSTTKVNTIITPDKTETTPKPYYITSRPVSIKATITTTSKSTNQPNARSTFNRQSFTTKLSSTNPTTTTSSPLAHIVRSTEQSTSTLRSPLKPIQSISSTLSSVLNKPFKASPVKNRQNLSSSHSTGDLNLINDNLVADEHYIVNNLTSIGLMDENFKPENLIDPSADSSSETGRLNSERATAMNAVLNEIAGISRTETDINIAFIILQIKNHPPEFPMIRPNITSDNNQNSIILGQIEEISRNQSFVQLEQELWITDQDHGLNGTFDVQLMDATKIFDIIPKTGYRNQTFQIQVINSNQLRLMENKQVNVKIIVTDRSPFKSLKNELIIAIQVIDTNDQFPQFTKDLFEATINEKAKIGTKITQIEATDSDSGEYGQVTYSHLLGDISNNLELNQETGVITLLNLDDIDREKQQFYKLIIYVCDNKCKPEESNSNQTLLLIEISDFNDMSPEFPVSRYDYLINSDLFTFSSPIIVSATDADEPNTPNSNVVYEIVSGNHQTKFKIDAITGEIKLTSPLLIEGSEKLPIIDLENEHPNYSGEDEESVLARNRIINYPWTEDNFDLVHMDKLFSYYSPVINLTVRAHDKGIPIQNGTVNVYIHCQNYINRTVVFMVNDSEQSVKRKKQEYERFLSEMASGRVRIKTIQTPPSATNLPNRTLVYSTITYPSQSMINVKKVNWYSSRILQPDTLNIPAGWTWFNMSGINRQGRNQVDTVNTHMVKTAGLDNNSFITWLLIMIILISLVFLFILIAIWCYFCGCRKRKNKINSADSNGYYSHHLKAQQMNRQLLKHQQLESDSIDSTQAEYALKTTDPKQLTNSTIIQRGNYPMSEFDAAAFSQAGKFKKRIKPGSAVFENTGYVSDADPSGNFILTTRKPRSAPDNSLRAYVDNTGVFTSDKVNYDRGSDVDAQSSPLDIYNEDAYSILNRVWFGERGEKRQPQLNQQVAKEQPNELQPAKDDSTTDPYATVRKNKVKFTDDGDSSSSIEETAVRRMSQDETSVKQLQDKHRTASQLTLRSQVDQIDATESKGKSDQIDQDLISRLPKAILKNQQKRFSTNASPASDTDSGIGHKEGVRPKSLNDRNESPKDKESIKKETSSQQSLPPTPPPLPSSMTSQQLHHHVAQKLHLKNEDVAQKKSVFTIAYNGVKTDRLNSADSSTIYI